MANLYTQFSFKLNVTDPEQQAFFSKENVERFAAQAEDTFPSCSVDVEVEKDGVYLFSMDGDADFAADLVQAFLVKFKLDYHVIFGVAFTCSKPRPGEFGGVAYLVTKDTVEVCNPEHELRNRLERA